MKKISKLRDRVLRAWLQGLRMEYVNLYQAWCLGRNMKPNWDTGFYQFLCMLTVEEDA